MKVSVYLAMKSPITKKIKTFNVGMLNIIDGNVRVYGKLGPCQLGSYPKTHSTPSSDDFTTDSMLLLNIGLCSIQLQNIVFICI